MTSAFDALLAERTKKGAATVHGAMMKCIDRNGKEIYSKTAGHTSLAADASPLTNHAADDVVLKLGSATKLITTIALLQCVDAGLLTLDEPIAARGILPELANANKPILERVDGTTLVTRPSTTPITARHLLTHTSGLGYWFTHPLLMQWKSAPGSGYNETAATVAERMGGYPLVFEPGAGWLYGCNLDWAGVAVSRLHGGMTLEEYMVEHIWKRVGCVAPFPTFHVDKRPEYAARLMQAAQRDADGGGALKPSSGRGFCANLEEDDEGGAGLAATMGDYLAVLRDLVADAPKLLRAETVEMMFTPQLRGGLAAGSSSSKNASVEEKLAMLKALRPAWDIVAGPVSSDEVDHGLGGLLLLGEAKEIGQPAGLLCWGGSPNIVWFVSRERRVAGFFGTQISPFGDSVVKELVDGWKRDFWEGFG